MALDWKRTRNFMGWASFFLLLISLAIGLIWGRWEGFDPKKWYKALQAGLLGFWIVAPPVWFWAEYFFLYKNPTSASVGLEEFKHGQDQAAKIWLAFVTLLAALYFGKDLVRDSSAAPGLQQPQSATTSGASVSNSSTAHRN